MARSTEPGQKLSGANGGFVVGDGDKVVGICNEGSRHTSLEGTEYALNLLIRRASLYRAR